jgi:hypothetical protein
MPPPANLLIPPAAVEASLWKVLDWSVEPLLMTMLIWMSMLLELYFGTPCIMMPTLFLIIRFHWSPFDPFPILELCCWSSVEPVWLDVLHYYYWLNDRWMTV